MKATSLPSISTRIVHSKIGVAQVGRNLRITFAVIAAAALLGVVVFQAVMAQQATQTAQPNAQTASQIVDETVVDMHDMTVTVSATGTVIPNHKVNLGFEVSAPVAEILVKEGQKVKRGDVLARLDTVEVSQALQSAEVALQAQQVSYNGLVATPRDVDVTAARSAVTAAQAASYAASQGATAEDVQIAQMQTELAKNQLWQAQLTRDQTLDIGPEFRAGGTGAWVQNDQLNGQVQSAEMGVDISGANYSAVVNQPPDRAALGSAGAQLVQAQVALNNLMNGPTAVTLRQAQIALQKAQIAVQQAKIAVNKAELLAPFDGVVATNNLVVGEVPSALEPAFVFINDDNYYVDLAIDESDVSDVKVGQKTSLSIDALGDEPITGTVTRVAWTPTRSGTLVTYTVRVTLDKSDAPVRADMTATATIVVEDLKEALVLPNRFIRIDRNSQKAYTTVQMPDGTFQEIEIQLGLRNDEETQVVSGLQQGQHVVLLPRSSFNPFGG